MVATHWTRRLGTALGAVLALLLLTAGPAAADLPAVVPDGFQDVPLATGLTAPTAVRFAPGLDGRMFVALKSGIVLAYDHPQDPAPTQVIDLSADVYDFWDRGLLGMALDPNFGSNGGYMYLLYARDAALDGTPWGDGCPTPPGADEDGCVVSGKLVRVMVDTFGVADLATLQTIIQDEWCQQFPSHSVGTVAFGPDGMLYVSAGEGANFNEADWGQFGSPSANPCGDPYFPLDSDASEGGALRAQDVRTNDDPAGLSGAVIRIDPVTGAAVSGNPFFSDGTADANKKRVIAYGMRNPFRFTFRPGTSDIWLGDVGWTTTEEIDKIDAADGVAENLGWPCFEGTAANPPYGNQDLCTSLPPGEVTMPTFDYLHEDDVAPGDGCLVSSGSSVSGLAFYGDGGYPDNYNGGLFFTDYARNCIWFVPKGGSGDPDFAGREVFARGAPGVGPVDLQTAPNGNLVYVFHDQTFGEIHEIRPVDQPTAKITVIDEGGGDFTFSASQSTGADLTYEWDLDDDGNWDPGETGVTASAHFDGRQAPTVSLRVTSHGIQDTTSVRVGVGNVVPTNAKITATVPSGGWSVGDRLHFAGSAVDSDQEDQTLTYTWALKILHCPGGTGCHTHVVQSHQGPTADFVAPSHEYPSRLEIDLTATDSLGFNARAQIILDPRVAQLTVRATPAPLTIRLSGLSGNSLAKTLIAGSAATISTTTPQHANGQDYKFMGWSDGDKRLSRIVAPRSSTVLTARFLSKPGAKERPTIEGRPRTGQTLTAHTGTWLGNELHFAYQWLRCGSTCTPIAGAAAKTYRLHDADLGLHLAVRVTASNELGSATQESGQTDEVLDGIAPKLKLSASKHPKLGNGRLRVKAACPTERCALRVRAVVRIEGRKAVTTKTVKKTVERGEKATLTIRLSKKLRRAVARALRAGKTVTARFEVIATDTAGNRRTRHFTAHLRR